MKTQFLREVYKVTERKEGAVFKTRKVGFAWVTLGKTPRPEYDENIQFVSLSTELSKKLGFTGTTRTVKDDERDIVITSEKELGL